MRENDWFFEKWIGYQTRPQFGMQSLIISIVGLTIIISASAVFLIRVIEAMLGWV